MNTTQPPAQRPARRKARARKSISLNSQMEGPLKVSSRETDGDLRITNSEGFIVAVVNQYAAKFKDKRDEANARLLAASYTAFDTAGRALNVDAATLAATVDLALIFRALRSASRSLTELDGLGENHDSALIDDALSTLPRELIAILDGE